MSDEETSSDNLEEQTVAVTAKQRIPVVTLDDSGEEKNENGGSGDECSSCASTAVYDDDNNDNEGIIGRSSTLRDMYPLRGRQGNTGSSITTKRNVHSSIPGIFRKPSNAVPMENKIEDPRLNYFSQNDLAELTNLSSGAAFQSRLPAEDLSPEEKWAFPDVNSSNQGARKTFILLRNRILRQWLQNPKKELTFQAVWSKLQQIPLAIFLDITLISNIFAYLNRYGFINFGLFENVSSPVQPNGKKVIIVGAGISGLVTARQLQRFGFEIVVLEARNRVGGRIATYRNSDTVADIGAMVIPGLGGNPLNVLFQQMNVKLEKISRKCPLYESNGNLVPSDKNKMIELEFFRLLEEVACYEVTSSDTEASLGNILELEIEEQEKEVRERFKKQRSKHQSIDRDMRMLLNKIALKKQALEDLETSLKKTNKMSHASVRKTLNETKQEYESLETHRQVLETTLEETRQQTVACSTSYLSYQERQLLDWHFATLELAMNAPLSRLSAKHWDDYHEFTGYHLVVQNGFSCLPFELAKDLNIQLHTEVQQIKTVVNSQIGEPSAEVEVVVADSFTREKVKTIRGDAVLCTLPLGVLQHSINVSARENKDCDDDDISTQNIIQFIPPLPTWKQDAILKLECGTINKVVLRFDNVFWAQKKCNMFGVVSPITQSRGECFLFWNVISAPVLIGMVAGEAASVVEGSKEYNDLLVNRCLLVLKQIFGANRVSSPRDSVVTRWKNDPYSRGAATYVAAGASSTHIDLLAAPLSGRSKEDTIPPTPSGAINPASHSHRLYFAGEHTARNYHGTVHGAFLSGLREAGRIADELLGRPYQAKPFTTTS